MRILTVGFLAAAALGALSTARAADLDYDVLRGSDDYAPAAPIIDWSGLYVGGHGGYSSAALGFRNALQPLIADMVRATVVEKEMAVSSLLSTRNMRRSNGSYGVFTGYNWQFDDIVLGLEADYTFLDVRGFSSHDISRSATTSDGYLNNVHLIGVSGTTIRDYGTIRARAGYALGSLLPYVTGGIAIGRAQITDIATVNVAGNKPSDSKAPLNIISDTEGYVKMKTMAGVALGAGLEYAITPNFLLRGEYQYVLFNDFDGHKVNVNTVRAGGAVKF